MQLRHRHNPSGVSAVLPCGADTEDTVLAVAAARAARREERP